MTRCQTRLLVLHMTASQGLDNSGLWLCYWDLDRIYCESSQVLNACFLSSYPTPHIHPRALFPCLIAAFLLYTPSHLSYPSYLLFIGPRFLIPFHFHFYKIIFLFSQLFFLFPSPIFLHTYGDTYATNIANHRNSRTRSTKKAITIIYIKLARIEILVHTLIHTHSL